MGIYDRDYMREPERKPADTPRTIARKGIVLAVCIVGVLLLASAVIKRNAAAEEAEIRRQRLAEEQMRSMFQRTVEMTSEKPPQPRQLIDVNTATAEELEKIPHITPGVAASLIAHRPYQELAELVVVAGIKKKRIEQLRAYLTVK
jgi:DNA uptake protein ComE-like DNA-binding protein